MSINWQNGTIITTNHRMSDFEVSFAYYI